MRLTIVDHYSPWMPAFRAEVEAALAVALDRFPDSFALDGQCLCWTDGTSRARVKEAVVMHNPSVGDALFYPRRNSIPALARAAQIVADRHKMEPLTVLPMSEGSTEGRIDVCHPLAQRQLSDGWNQYATFPYYSLVVYEATVLNAYTDEQLGGM